VPLDPNDGLVTFAFEIFVFLTVEIENQSSAPRAVPPASLSDPTAYSCGKKGTTADH